MTQPKLAESLGWHGDSKRGAALGRADHQSLHPHATRTFYLQRLRLNSGGYDSGGAYWGIGQPLYWACCPSGSIEFFFRAANRDGAKTELLRRYPGARFYR